jgi:HEPN pEK499 p136
VATISRNTLRGFGKRTRKNLAFVASRAETGDDVHPVTQLLLSLLGLVVFPREALKYMDPHPLKRYSLHKLTTDGWPSWHYQIGKAHTLAQLTDKLRNSIAHRGVFFSSDSRILSEVDVTFWNRRSDNTINWCASINAAGLRDYVERFSALIDEIVD